MLLIYPPVSKSCEPPTGIAFLAGALTEAGVPVRVVDANVEGMHFLLSLPVKKDDTWTRRALRHKDAHLSDLRRWPVYAAPDRYRRAVMDLNRILAVASSPARTRVSLADYEDRHLSPARSRDLIAAAGSFEESLFFPYFRRRIVPLVPDSGTETIGISINYLSQALPAFALIGFLRSIAPRARIVVGGGLATSWLRHPDWQNPFGGLVDQWVAGPGEDALLALAGRPAAAGERVRPDFSSLLNLAYLAPGPVIPYAASRGCYWRRCAFCPERAEGSDYRPTAAPRVSSDLKALGRRYRPALLHLVDNALSPALLKTLARHPPGTPWYGFARITPHLADPDFCRALRESGCVMLKLGLESGDERVLEKMKKGIDPTLAARVLDALAAAGIATYVYLLFGTPWEDEAAAETTLAFAARCAGSIDFLNLAVFNLPVHGPEADVLETRPFYAGDLNLYADFTHPKGWHRGRVRRFLDKRFRRHPAVSPILRRQPPLFTSNHAPLMVMAQRKG
jgi:radical SAM superfamily enzyme YgiQ (UPF0313 family)